MATIQELEAELRQLFQKQNYVDAMDVYEELERTAGGLRPQHLIGRAQCLIKLRRKQDAKNDLAKAYQIDPSFQPTIHMLNENFPGWEAGMGGGTPAAPRPAAPAPMPQAPPQHSYAPPAPQSYGQPAPFPGGFQAPPAPQYQPAPQFHPAPAPQYQPSAPTQFQPAPAPQFRGAPAPGGFPGAPSRAGAMAATMPPPAEPGLSGPKVNWKFVLEDLEAARRGPALR